MSDGKIKIQLVPAPDDSELFGRVLQADIRAVHRALQSNGQRVIASAMTFDAVDATGGLTGQFILAAAQLTVQIIASATTIWLAGTSGRSFKIKIGDVEVEAKSREDVDWLLEKVKELDANKQQGVSEGKESADKPIGPTAD